MGATHNLWSQCEQQLDRASGANLRAVIDPAGSAVVDVLVVWPFTDLFDQPLCSSLKGNSL
jgi:hypothetical protein